MTTRLLDVCAAAALLQNAVYTGPALRFSSTCPWIALPYDFKPPAHVTVMTSLALLHYGLRGLRGLGRGRGG
jgi:hypothetical protein